MLGKINTYRITNKSITIHHLRCTLFRLTLVLAAEDLCKSISFGLSMFYCYLPKGVHPVKHKEKSVFKINFFYQETNENPR